MSAQCRACLNVISNECIHLGSAFTEEQTYFDCFNECTQLEATWNDNYPQVICLACHRLLKLCASFIKTAQKSDQTLRSNFIANVSGQRSIPNNEIFEETDIENMEFVVLESFNDEMLNEKMLTDDLVISEENETESNAGFIALVTCEVCAKIFESNEILDLHALIFHQNKTSGTCALCSECLKNDFEDITAHISLEHPIEYGKLFNNFAEDSNAENVSLIEESQNSVKDNVVHEGLEIDDPTVEVPKTGLEKVIETHQKEFLCSFCSREFKNQKSLSQHEKIHLEAAAEDSVFFVCTDCDRQCMSAALLEQHRKNTHKQREYVCNMCGNAFKLKNQLKNHIKLHLEKNLPCPHCDKKYARHFKRHLLRVHNATISDENLLEMFQRNTGKSARIREVNDSIP